MPSDAKIRATLKIVPDQNGFVVPRPSAEQMEKAIDALQKLGFDVLRRTRFGVEVQGTLKQYYDHLNVSVPPHTNSLVRSVAQAGSGLYGLVDSIEIIPAAKLVV